MLLGKYSVLLGGHLQDSPTSPRGHRPAAAVVRVIATAVCRITAMGNSRKDDAIDFEVSDLGSLSDSFATSSPQSIESVRCQVKVSRCTIENFRCHCRFSDYQAGQSDDWLSVRLESMATAEIALRRRQTSLGDKFYQALTALFNRNRHDRRLIHQIKYRTASQGTFTFLASGGLGGAAVRKSPQISGSGVSREISRAPHPTASIRSCPRVPHIGLPCDSRISALSVVTWKGRYH
ncbi:hypothetical protein RRG08_034594 [Elysia crispata]|uniref:Uncharacterized protein n=1 Tax=Elysia crispata TaxID=231223 RepID=A0AAE1B1T8_9GAST|nr:hypothetical protein RRG08_034594 [Elysia crispata]